jgi:hypothetical protein
MMSRAAKDIYSLADKFYSFASTDCVDLTKIEKISYSSVMRELNKKDESLRDLFAKTYKDNFDKLYLSNSEDIEDMSLVNTLKQLSSDSKIKLK